MSEPIWKTSLEQHGELFRHYSSLLFRARILIVSVILVVVAVLCGMGTLPGLGNASVRLGAEPVLAYAASLVVALLYSMETAYIRRLAEVAASASLQKDVALAMPFFVKYRALWHWPLLALYFLAVFFFLSVFWSKGIQGFPPPWGFASYPILVVPLILLAVTGFRHYRRLGDIHYIDNTPEENEPHNTHATPDASRALRGRRR